MPWKASNLLCTFADLPRTPHRPVVNRYIRIDEAGRAQAIQYTDLNYSPRERDIRTYLTDWTGYRHTINRETMAKKDPMNYFLSSALAAQLIGQENANDLTPRSRAGADRAEPGLGQQCDDYLDVPGEG